MKLLQTFYNFYKFADDSIYRLQKVSGGKFVKIRIILKNFLKLLFI